MLHSTVPLPPALANRLYRAALELQRGELAVTKLSGDLAMGEVRRLGRSLLLGSIGGPGFEAHLDTPNGSGVVRFILTRQALEHAGIEAPEDSPAPHRGMMN